MMASNESICDMLCRAMLCYGEGYGCYGEGYGYAMPCYTVLPAVDYAVLQGGSV